MNKEMLEILYGDMEEERLELLIKTKDIRYVNKIYWQNHKELEKSLRNIAGMSKDMFGKPDTILMNPRMHSIIKDLMSAEYLPVDKKNKKK